MRVLWSTRCSALPEALPPDSRVETARLFTFSSDFTSARRRLSTSARAFWPACLTASASPSSTRATPMA